MDLDQCRSNCNKLGKDGRTWPDWTASEPYKLGRDETLAMYLRSVFTPCKQTLQISLELKTNYPKKHNKNIKNVHLAIKKKQI
jgi:hypothetical protein